jgi:hypothetical protein
MSKRPLMSVAVIRISVHPAWEKPNNTMYTRSRGLHIQQPSVKSLLGRNQTPTPVMKSWLPAIVWPYRYSGLPHSPTIKLPWSREAQFDKIVTKLLGSSNPIKIRHAVNTILNLLTGIKMTRSLIDTCGGYHLGSSDNHNLLPTLPIRWYSTFPYLPRPVTH